MDGNPATLKALIESAGKGNAAAQNNLGYCCLNGVGVTKDSAKAVQLLQKAAEQDYVEAQFNLGCCY